MFYLKRRFFGQKIYFVDLLCTEESSGSGHGQLHQRVLSEYFSKEVIRKSLVEKDAFKISCPGKKDP